jgi:hypothetical protein
MEKALCPVREKWTRMGSELRDTFPKAIGGLYEESRVIGEISQGYPS